MNPRNRLGFSARISAPWGVSGGSSLVPAPAKRLQAGCIRRLGRLKAYRTANSGPSQTGGEMRLSGLMSANAVSMATIADGDWGLIAPFGDHPSPDGKYIQHFDRAQSDKMVATWNSFSGKCARLFKNMWHKLGPKFTAPVWEGHPDDFLGGAKNIARFPVERLLAEVEDLRTANAGLEGRIYWNPKGMESRARGPLYPTAYWFHELPSGDPLTVFPELLASIGLWPDVNIKGVPAWTSNAAFPDVSASREAQSTANQQQKNNMLKKLIEKLGLNADATEDQVTEAVAALQSTANSAATNLTTANAAKQTLETQLSTANSNVTALTTERDQLKEQASQLSTANATLTDGILDLFEAAGKFTPAQRAENKAKFTGATANSAAAVITELKNKKAEMNTNTIELNGNQVDLSTANARSAALETAVAQRMEKDKCDRTVAFDRVMEDPAYKQLVDAMKPKPAA